MPFLPEAQKRLADDFCNCGDLSKALELIKQAESIIRYFVSPGKASRAPGLDEMKNWLKEVSGK